MKPIPIKLVSLQTPPKKWTNWNSIECKIYYSDGTSSEKVLLTENPYNIIIARICLINKIGTACAEKILDEIEIIESSSYSEGVRSECMHNAGDDL